MNKAVFITRNGVLYQPARKGRVRFEAGDYPIYSFVREALYKFADQRFLIAFIDNLEIMGSDMAMESDRRLKERVRHIAPGSMVWESLAFQGEPTELCLPSPHVLKVLQQQFELDMDSSVMITAFSYGIQAAIDAGIKRIIFVKTGRSKTTRTEDDGVWTVANLNEAADLLKEIVGSPTAREEMDHVEELDAAGDNT